MKYEMLHDLAMQERLYPALIFYGADLEERQQKATELARVLLCEVDDDRPCGHCKHCRRIAWPASTEEKFHPDFHVLVRDLRTSTSADATKRFLNPAYSAPFEARGQVFVVSEAETLTAGAADALLKLLEEPPTASPRHFILLSAGRLDLLPTLRSRSMSVFLGQKTPLDEDEVETVSAAFGGAFDAFLRGRSAIDLLAAAEALGKVKGWDDPRARRPWAVAAASVMRYLERTHVPPDIHRALLDYAHAILGSAHWRMRGITAPRLLEGLLSRHLGSARV